MFKLRFCLLCLALVLALSGCASWNEFADSFGPWEDGNVGPGP